MRPPDSCNESNAMKEIAPRTASCRLPMAGDWPQDGLEWLGACPVCGTQERNVIYANLHDKIFFAAPGAWTMWQCASRHVGYLDPRPSRASMHAAYSSYYTHSAGTPPRLARILFQIQIGIRHSYLNKRFGYKLKDALPLGWVVYMIKPAQAIVTNNTVRHLPAPQWGRNRLLDIGCGDGQLLTVARDIGYDVTGLEIDAVARAVARKRGHRLYEGALPGAKLEQKDFDHITLNHVLEHFHDPVAALREVYGLLRQGGRVWLQIPNFSALSLKRFKENSRLLEPPRHLVMFDLASLTSLLQQTGFVNVEFKAPPKIRHHNFMFGQSWMIEQGLAPYETSENVVPAEILTEARAAFNAEGGAREYGEIITMTAEKPLLSWEKNRCNPR